MADFLEDAFKAGFEAGLATEGPGGHHQTADEAWQAYLTDREQRRKAGLKPLDIGQTEPEDLAVQVSEDVTVRSTMG